MNLRVDVYHHLSHGHGDLVAAFERLEATMLTRDEFDQQMSQGFQSVRSLLASELGEMTALMIAQRDLAGALQRKLDEANAAQDFTDLAGRLTANIADLEGRISGMSDALAAPPAPAPEPGPEPTPEPTPEPGGGEVTPTPEPGGEVTPTPEPTPGGEVTPTPEPAPEPTPAPEPGSGGEVTPPEPAPEPPVELRRRFR